MGRPPSNGGPSFRFNPTEVAEMEAVLQAHHTQVPAREVLLSLAEKFSASSERSGKFVVQVKQVWNWFQNKRYAIRAKTFKAPNKVPAHVTPQSEPTIVRTIPQVPQPCPLLSVTARPLIHAQQGAQPIAAPSASGGRNGLDNVQMEFEAKSARDGAWYDVASFLSHKSMETGDPEVLVRFAGFGAEEDEWVNVRRNVRQRSLPCESSECVAVLKEDLILCFQEGKEQALYFDAHVLDAQRRRHDVRGCRCRFLVRYDHDESEEIVPLRKICRRPETDYRLEQLNADSSATMKQRKGSTDAQTANNASPVVVAPPAETVKRPPPPATTISTCKPTETMTKKMKTDELVPTSAEVHYSDSSLKEQHEAVKQQKTSTNQICNSIKVYPPGGPQKPSTEFVPKAELTLLTPAEPTFAPPPEPTSIIPAEPTSIIPAEQKPNPASENTESLAAAICSVPTPNPIETSDEQLHPEKDATIAAPNPETTDNQLNPETTVTRIAAAPASTLPMSNPLEATDEWLKAECDSHASVVGNENQDVLSRLQLNPENDANAAASNPIETTDEQLNSKTTVVSIPASSSPPMSNPLGHDSHASSGHPDASSVANENKDVLLRPQHENIAAPNAFETTGEQLNPETTAALIDAISTGTSLPISNPIEAKAEGDSHAPDGHTEASVVANENKDEIQNNAENGRNGNTGISETPIRNDAMFASHEAMDYASDGAMTYSTDMLDVVCASGSD
ncbi:hypothetical protein DM860_014834 [Cuscuta australis]|uniref:Homeobox domain-containing protein n=1 Tax=Cuscuta australis TaxID=267555 RepID=A0A328DI24_9ASTE|nr:hypothetical protein DM860_014834 [Cuscuta australis]